MQDPAKTFLSTTNVHGTPQYMAPEQFAGAHCDEKVDVYALATILNECATRRPPWRDFGNAFQVSSLPLPRPRAALQSAVRQAQTGMRLQIYSTTQIPHTIHCKCCTRCCKAKGGRKKQTVRFAAQGLNGGPRPEGVWQSFL